MAMMQYSDQYGPVVPTRTQMYGAGTSSQVYGQVVPASNQVVSYGSNQMMVVPQQQQYTSTDLVAYDRYLNNPPGDVKYKSSKSHGDYMTDGWNGLWRQSSRPYIMTNQPPPAQVYTQPVVQQTSYVQPQTMYVQQPAQMVQPQTQTMYVQQQPAQMVQQPVAYQQAGVQYGASRGGW